MNPVNTMTFWNLSLARPCRLVGAASILMILSACPYRDQDGDGITLDGGRDCNDGSAIVHPGAREICGNEIDEDCSGLLDDRDLDGDGFECVDGDCDDDNELIRPDASELPGDALDNDCDTQIDEIHVDADEDGYYADDEDTTLQDCNDEDPEIHPGAAEKCDESDRNCDDDPIKNATDKLIWYQDTDLDLYGGLITIAACTAPDGFVSLSGDCNELDDDIHPGAPETCDSIDNDCDEEVDEDPLCIDDDGDTFSEFQNDCDDTNPAISPSSPDPMNNFDDNCDDLVDGIRVACEKAHWTHLDDAFPLVVDGNSVELCPGAGVEQARLDDLHDIEIRTMDPEQVQLTATPGNDAITIQNCTAIVVKNIGIGGGRTGISSASSDLTLSNVSLSGATVAGALLEGGTIWLRDGSRFSDNDGAGVILRDQTSLSVMDCTVETNLDGGLVVSSPISMTLERCTFSQNGDGLDRGALDINGGGTIEIVNPIFNQDDLALHLVGDFSAPVMVYGLDATATGGISLEDAPNSRFEFYYSDLIQSSVYALRAQAIGELLMDGSLWSDGFGHGVYIQGANSVTLENCRATDNAKDGIFIDGTAVLAISDCRVDGNQDGGIYVRNTVDLFEIHDSKIDDNSVSSGVGGIRIDGGGEGSAILNNDFISNEGINAAHLQINGGTVLVGNNLFVSGYANYSGAISVTGEASAQILYNTLVDNEGEREGAIYLNTTGSVAVYNNIVVDTKGCGIEIEVVSSNYDIDFNDLYNNTDDYCGKAIEGENDLHVWPDFEYVNYVTTYNLSPESECVDAGSSKYSAVLSTDYLGTLRPQGSAPDMGRHELIVSP